MNYSELKSADCEFLTSAQIAPFLGCDPQDIRITAKRYPERLGFNVAVIGTRVKIPRRAFLNWLEGRCKDGN